MINWQFLQCAWSGWQCFAIVQCASCSIRHNRQFVTKCLQSREISPANMPLWAILFLSATVFVPKWKPTQICTWSSLLRISESSFKQILQECSKCLQMIYWESIENLLESIKIYWESVETNINAIITITQNALYSYRWLWVPCPCTACSLHILSTLEYSYWALLRDFMNEIH